jgi:hypothetical protein
VEVDDDRVDQEAADRVDEDAHGRRGG